MRQHVRQAHTTVWRPLILLAEIRQGGMVAHLTLFTTNPGCLEASSQIEPRLTMRVTPPPPVSGRRTLRTCAWAGLFWTRRTQSAGV
ncbi:hypothetical protein LY76DRAFT_234311 [Colletotrichum caudatum]|nr:hypothetical protein LY76DRAFT_234311 [Colletotrichum caudatum]